MSRIHTCKSFGIELTYIITDYGNYLYYQSSKSEMQWLKEIMRRLIKAKLDDDCIDKLMLTYCTNQYYYNKHFYKPVPFMIQMMAELGLDD